MFTTRTKNFSEADVYGGVHMYTRSAYIQRGTYRYIGAWGRRYGCARAFSQPQGTNHYFIFHFVYLNSRGDANPKDSDEPGRREGGRKKGDDEVRENERVEKEKKFEVLHLPESPFLSSRVPSSRLLQGPHCPCLQSFFPRIWEGLIQSQSGAETWSIR